MKKLFAALDSNLFLAIVVIVCSVVVVRELRNNAHRSPAKRTAVSKTMAFMFWDPSQGDIQNLWSDTPAVLVAEYTDFQCPECGRAANDTIGPRLRRLVSDGSVVWVHKDFPSISKHPWAMRAAMAARCSGAESFWGVRAALFAIQKEPTDQRLNEVEDKHDLPMDSLSACIDSPTALIASQRIASNVEEGRNLGVTSTPSYLVGKLNKGMLFTGYLLIAPEWEQLEDTIRDVR